MAILSALTNPPVVPAGYTLTLRDARESPNEGYFMDADAWADR